jgi:hypothetical protein
MQHCRRVKDWVRAGVRDSVRVRVRDMVRVRVSNRVKVRVRAMTTTCYKLYVSTGIK